MSVPSWIPPGRQAERIPSIQATSLFSFDHRAFGLALRPFHAVVSRREELLAERGIDVSNDTIRRWFLKFRRPIASNLRRSRSSARRHLDDKAIKFAA